MRQQPHAGTAPDRRRSAPAAPGHSRGTASDKHRAAARWKTVESHRFTAAVGAASSSIMRPPGARCDVMRRTAARSSCGSRMCCRTVTPNTTSNWPPTSRLRQVLDPETGSDPPRPRPPPAAAPARSWSDSGPRRSPGRPARPAAGSSARRRNRHRARGCPGDIRDPRAQRQPLLELDGPVVELGHPIRTHRGQARTFAREPPRPVFPVRRWVDRAAGAGIPRTVIRSFSLCSRRPVSDPSDSRSDPGTGAGGTASARRSSRSPPSSARCA